TATPPEATVGGDGTGAMFLTAVLRPGPCARAHSPNASPYRRWGGWGESPLARDVRSAAAKASLDSMRASARPPVHCSSAAARDPRPRGDPWREAVMAARVLLIEDDLDSREAVETLLRLWGYDVAVAKDGESGIAMAEIFRPQVVVTDLLLPALDGYEVAER